MAEDSRTQIPLHTMDPTSGDPERQVYPCNGSSRDAHKWGESIVELKIECCLMSLEVSDKSGWRENREHSPSCRSSLL